MYNEQPLDNRKLFSDDINFRITSLLIVYNELSLTELNRRIRGSKSTAHRHLAILIERGLVEVSAEIKVRSDRKAKYYRLTKRAYESLGLSSTETPEERLQSTVNSYLYYKMFIDEFVEYLNKGEENHRIHRFQKLLSDNTFNLWTTLLTEQEFLELKKEIDHLHARFTEIQANISRETLHPYLFMMNFIPFKEMLDEKNPSFHKGEKNKDQL